jgi:AcrR family transcriptional regulator
MIQSDWSGAVKGAKRNLVLDAARDEFAEKGLEGVTMRSIALRACFKKSFNPLLTQTQSC